MDGFDSSMTREQFEALHKDLKKWGKTNMWLARAMLFLTIIMMLTVAFQVYVQFSQDSGQARMTEPVKTFNF